MSDFRFNRKRHKGQYVYINEFSRDARKFGDNEYEGYIKCKLMHGQGYSLVAPDQIYVEIGGALHWIQPLYFSGNQIAKFDGFSICDLLVDISYGNALKIRFFDSGLVNRLIDGSLLYRCQITAPKMLHKFTSGSARFIKGRPQLKLYHHTSMRAKKLILDGSSFRTSTWNIQGNKECMNYSFLYFTALPAIHCAADLQQIAMSHNGKIAFRADQNLTDSPDLVLNVYRESTENRTQTIGAWVKAEELAPQPCFRHMPPDDFGYHEVVSPFIQRIPSVPGEEVSIHNAEVSANALKVCTHAVVGDATTVEGLRAPFDEEDTTEQLRIEFISAPDEITSFWMDNGNVNHYQGKEIEMFAFG